MPCIVYISTERGVVRGPGGGGGEANISWAQTEFCVRLLVRKEKNQRAMGFTDSPLKGWIDAALELRSSGCPPTTSTNQNPERKPTHL